MTNRENKDAIMMTPGIAGYWTVKRSGRHGSFSDWKAVGMSYLRVSK
jgi:uncharacterized membrane protein